ncbi:MULTISPECIES: MFS transporter [Pseudonocardia]|uniref:Antiseptic resistance protein n=2 Tax=Pseudonocardia TaxID=1847 RepID=A0A1Y2MNY2_PSEAH|nr:MULTISPECIES: MFS transporter [Pseudonocardia]OSY36950.1 Antiseptic resistance protein [Pseudonocardia autotrophica]TDN75633.1 DHA2 family multidrug resistance protein-like MFS transporter [Pseudonocardia autotrophica]BBF99605.1 MFS transporter [Pseudonocardia autotrophica]GEC28624.1 MFS transporter [Pseudonocardia saturnea]
MPPSVAHRAGPRQWIGLGVLALPTALLGLDVTVLYLALPELALDLRPSSVQTLWIMDVYGFMIAGLLITMGTLGDRTGRRRLLMIGLVAFGLASVAAAFATSAGMLIVARAALGVAGATLMPSTLALIGNMFTDVRQRGLAIGVWATMFALGMALGPLAGGLLLERFWWGSVFLLAVPVVVVVLVVAPLLLPEYRDPAAGRLDLTSVAMSLLAILPLVYAVKHGAEAGLDPRTVAAATVGAVFTVLFVRRQGRLDDPLLDVRLFRVPAFGAALLVLLVALVGVGGAMYLVTQHLQFVEGFSPLTAGLWMAPPALAMFVAAIGAPLLARRIRPGVVVAVTLVASAVGHLLFVAVDGPGNAGLVVSAFALVYLGLGAVAALGTDLVVGSAPAHRAGSAAAMSETVQELGIAVGVAVLGSVANAVYRSTLAAGAGHPDLGGPAAASLAGAVAADPGPAALDAAREAQAAGLGVVGLVTGIAVAALAVPALFALRRVAPVGRTEPPGCS